MSNLDKSGEREIAARITAETYKVEAAIKAALELINEPSAELIASCENGLAGAKNLREFFADWLFDPNEHCHTCFEVGVITEQFHADSDKCRECVISENDPQGNAYLLSDN